jgi:hypothetical protein
MTLKKRPILTKKVEEVKTPNNIILKFWKEQKSILAIRALINDISLIYSEFYLDLVYDTISNKNKRILYPNAGLIDSRGILILWGYSDDFSNLYFECSIKQGIDIIPRNCFVKVPVEDIKKFLEENKKHEKDSRKKSKRD